MKKPTDLCGSCGKPRAPHKYRHRFVEPAAAPVTRSYRVIAHVTISLHVEVKAASPEAARALAGELPVMSLCHQCASGEAGVWSTSGELDGELEIQDVELA